MESPFLTTAEVAQYLRVDVQTVRRWCIAGDLPAVRIATGGVFRISRVDLDEFVRSARVGRR